MTENNRNISAAPESLHAADLSYLFLCAFADSSG